MTEHARLSAREKLSYGAGEVASNLAWNMATGFLLVYYTDVALIPVAALGVLMLVTRVLDALFDPLAGFLVDRTQSRWGKAKPYLLWAPVPFAVLFVATFTVPPLSPELKLVYAYVTFTAVGFFVSMLYVPYGALLPMMTRRKEDKIETSSYRAMGTSIASILAYGLAMPLVGMIGKGDRQLGFTAAAAILATVTVLLYMVTYFNTKERYTLPASQTAPLRVSLPRLIGNPVWMTTFVLGLFVFIRIGVMVSCLAFFTKDVLGKPGLVSLILPIMSVMILAGGFLSRFYLVKFGLARANIVALVIATLMWGCLYFVEGNIPLFVTLFVVSNIASGIGAASNFAMSAEAVEWNEQNHGHRDEGLISAGISFGLKVGMALGTSLTAFALASAGYNPAASSPGTSDTLRVLLYGGPILLNILMIVCWARYQASQSRVAAPVAA